MQGRASPLTHTCLRMQGFQSSGTTEWSRPALTESPHSRSTLQFSLRQLSLCGQLYRAGVNRGIGSYCTVHVRENAGKGRDPDSPLTPALCPSSALSSWLFLSKCASEGPRLKTYTQPQIPSLPSPKAQPAPPHLGGAVTEESV